MSDDAQKLGSLDRSDLDSSAHPDAPEGVEEPLIVEASAVIDAPAGLIFELIADPARQIEWDGNDNLGQSSEGQRVREYGDVFGTELTSGGIRENHVVEFAEGTLIAWMPAEQGEQPFGQVWRWELVPAPDGSGTQVTQTYDWSGLPADSAPKRLERARSTTSDSLMASIRRLKELAEREASRR